MRTNYKIVEKCKNSISDRVLFQKLFSTSGFLTISADMRDEHYFIPQNFSTVHVLDVSCNKVRKVLEKVYEFYFKICVFEMWNICYKLFTWSWCFHISVSTIYTIMNKWYLLTRLHTWKYGHCLSSYFYYFIKIFRNVLYFTLQYFTNCH